MLLSADALAVAGDGATTQAVLQHCRCKLVHILSVLVQELLHRQLQQVRQGISKQSCTHLAPLLAAEV
jgi:hypothetical protein